MISNTSNPVEWALFLMDLDDVKEHLDSLINEMNQEGSIEETEFRIQLGHIYAHLNRSWNSRNLEGEIPQDKRDEFSRFPTDIDPIG